jgi:large subunit ribosomal protein L21e
VNGRIIQKRLHVRIEHVQPSRCREEFLNRVKNNEVLKKEAKAKGEKAIIKRQPKGPRPGFLIAESAVLETVTPIPYDVVNDLKGGY